MNAPKLELCVGILQILENNGQLSATNIAVEVKINRNLLEQCIKILAEQGMVRKADNNTSVVYDITQSGEKVLKFFKLGRSPKTNRTLDDARLVNCSQPLNPLKP